VGAAAAGGGGGAWGMSAVVQYASCGTHAVPSHTHCGAIHTQPGYAGDTHQLPVYGIHALPPQSQAPVPQWAPAPQTAPGPRYRWPP
jgi:hypothetical protein